MSNYYKDTPTGLVRCERGGGGTCLVVGVGVLGLPVSWEGKGWRLVICRATRSFIIEWRACLSSTQGGQRHRERGSHLKVFHLVPHDKM